MRRPAFAFLVLVVIVATAQADPRPDKVDTYKTVDGHKLRAFMFFPPGHKPTDKAPAIVLFFGGGWKTGAPGQFYRQAHYLASRGMVAVCPVYRTEKRHKTTPQECVKDGKSAIRWVRGHAAELGVDPDRIAAGGGSAGGHVAAATATLDGFNEPGEDTSISCRPNALVLFNPVFDNGPDGYGHDRVKDYWKSISPMHNLNKKTPPTLVMLGTADSLIPVATAKQYKRLMTQAGVRCDLRLYDGEKHGFFNQSKFHETLLATDEFLTSLGYLEGKPTLKRGQYEREKKK
ncbi:MAG: alpha/beta hydrolase [Pirellulales bacterium]|nr:alpha/beta hydrolase [Pirellulales bacterium]